MTRSTDRNLTLEERTAIANTKNADLFISIHTNAARDRRATGIAAANRAALCAIRGELGAAARWHKQAHGNLSALGDPVLLARLRVARGITAFMDARRFGNAEPDEALEQASESVTAEHQATVDRLQARHRAGLNGLISEASEAAALLTGQATPTATEMLVMGSRLREAVEKARG